MTADSSFANGSTNGKLILLEKGPFLILIVVFHFIGEEGGKWPNETKNADVACSVS